MRKTNSLQRRIALYLAITMLISALAVLFVARVVAKNKIEESASADILLKQNAFDETFLDIVHRVTLTHLFLFDDANEVQLMLESNTMSFDEVEDGIHYFLTDQMTSEDTFEDIVIYQDGQYYRGQLGTALVSYPAVSILEATLSLPQDQLFFIAPCDDEQGNDYLVFARKIKTMYPGSQTIALSLYYIPMTMFSTLLMQISDELGATSLYATTILGDKVLLYQSESITDSATISLSSNLASTENTYPQLRFEVTSTLSEDLLFEGLKTLDMWVVILISASVLFIILVSSQMARGITKPVNKLIQGLRSFSKNNDAPHPDIASPKDEIYELEKTYDEMIERIVELIKTNNLEMENKRKLELYALQMQINPHFLYNTLDTIAWMAKLQKQPQIERLVLALARFFRISLHKGDKYIAIEEEFELIRNFVEIEMIRFPDLFEVHYEMDNHIAKTMTLKLILQPIVENAIKHGIAVSSKKGHLWIRAYRKDDLIIYEVEDDGVGFIPKEDLLADDRIPEGLGGYGLKNVDERIKLEYGRDMGISIVSEIDKGTLVRVTIRP